MPKTKNKSFWKLAIDFIMITLSFSHLSQRWFGLSPVSYWNVKTNPHQKEIDEFTDEFIKKFL